MALRRSTLVFSTAVLLVLVAGGAAAQGENNDSIARVEEDWELVIGDPDPSVAGPQITCVISPVGNADSLHAIFNLNHRTFDDFLAGGIQLQIWHCETPIADKNHPNSKLIANTGEHIKWTQEMSITDDGKLRFAVKNGTSQTWGSFGGQGYLTATVSTPLENLNAYSPAVSVKNSGVVFASNRVQSLVLKRIRVHTVSGDVQTIDLNQATEN